MAFEKVDTQVDFPAQERAILAFWKQYDIFARCWSRNRGKPTWSFLDGPITANNPMGVHHAWGRTYKDTFQRYFAMAGHELRYQNGFDCQGLWVEVEVEKELGLKSKRDIENLVPGDPFASIDRFVQLCKQRVDRYARIQTEQSIRLGYWMDWDEGEDWARPPDERRSYYTMSNENNYTIWTFLKKCHQRGLIYRGYDSMPWCPRCAVGLSQMEMHEGYQRVAHRAVFVRFPIRGKAHEFLLVWTTTPWTLTSNVAAAVHPELKYLRVKHKDEIYYLAKGAFTAQRLEEQFKRKEWVEGVPKLRTLEQIFKEKGGYELAGEVKGREILNWAYDGPFDELEAQGCPTGYPKEIAKVVLEQDWAPERAAREVHRVIAWDAVGEAEGTGIVHIAPGCGKEDFLLGKTERLPPIAPLDECGVFLPGFGQLEGREAIAHATTDMILDDLQRKGLLFAFERYPHNYPHCWRCKTELLFRLVDEWFIDMSWRDEIKRVVEDVVFLPEVINGKARELDWLSNMGDWMISKKRFWGLALPIWVCGSCAAFDVVGSREELERRATAGWAEFAGHSPHRPWIDGVKIRCNSCGQEASRIADVGNPWLDAGIVPYSTMKYNSDQSHWHKWFPADFITESFPGQFRNWFYAILAMSTMMENRAPMRVLFGHAQVRDEHGEEMHKSKGNAIEFNEAADKMGADVMRWLYARQNPAHNINFGYGPADELRAKFVLKLWNTYAFFCNYARLDGFDPAAPAVPLAQRPDIDRWILSDLQLLVRSANQSFRSYNLMAFCQEAEKFTDEKLSNWYIRRNRRRFWKSEQGSDKQAAYQTLYTVLMTLVKALAPVMPFLTEAMYQNLKGPHDPDSVHLCDYPVSQNGLVDADLSSDMNGLLRLVSLGSAARNTARTKVRQPLAEIRVQPADDRDRRAVERFADQICEELNVKTVVVHDGKQSPLLQLEIKPNPKALGPKVGALLKEVQTAIARQDPAEMAARWQNGQAVELVCSDTTVAIEAADVFQQWKAPDGWAGVADRGTQVSLDVRITEGLAREGMAREVVRHVQDLRKKASLEMEDRIILYLSTEAPRLQAAIETYRDYIARETLTREWRQSPLGSGAQCQDVKIEGQALHIELMRAT